MKYYSPSETAERTGFSLDTLRYYERIGLLDSVHRASSGHRRFTDDDLGWLGTLSCLRNTGMPIAEMRRFAELCRDGDHNIDERIALLEKHDARVSEEIAGMLDRQKYIRNKVKWYRDFAAQAAKTAESAVSA